MKVRSVDAAVTVWDMNLRCALQQGIYATQGGEIAAACGRRVWSPGSFNGNRGLVAESGEYDAGDKAYANGN